MRTLTRHAGGSLVRGRSIGSRGPVVLEPVNQITRMVFAFTLVRIIVIMLNRLDSILIL